MKRIIFAILTIVFFNGCHNQVATCPHYPKPSKAILTSIKSLKDVTVDKWMIKQMKLFKKLKVCNGL